MEQVYCVMDMPLSVIRHYLSSKSATKSIESGKTVITALAADCLRQVASQPENIQLAVVEGEMPLHRFCRSSASLHHNIGSSWN